MSTPNNKLSGEGKALLTDFTNVVEQAKVLLLIKNNDQILHEFIWQTQQLAKSGQAPGTAGMPDLSVTSEKATRDGQKALEGLQTLGTLIISNGWVSLGTPVMEHLSEQSQAIPQTTF